MEVRELHLYAEKVEEEDIKGMFDRIVKAKFPLFGFLSFDDVLSMNAFQFVVKRDNNTVRFYIKEKDSLQNISHLMFPFKMCEPSLIKISSGSYLPFPRIYVINGAKHDLLDFMLKEDVEEVRLGITKVTGGFFATGTVITKDKRLGKLFVLQPQKFLTVNLEKNPSIYIELLEPLPKRIATTSEYPIFEETGMTLGVDNYDPFQHTLIAGTSGSGKTKGLFVLLRALEARYGKNVRIIIVDPHGEFAKLMPYAKIVDFVGNYVEPLDVGKDKSPMLTQLVSQLVASSIGQENQYSERVLFYTVHLLSSIGKLELNNIAALLTDSSVKAEFVSQCDNDEVKRFFDEEYNDIHIHHFNNAILPILNFIGEYQLYLGKEKQREGMMELLQKNRVSIISFDPKFFGRRMISFLAGAIINQMYILAITGKLQDKPTIMVVDEFPRVETRVTKDILSETRKFNLFAYLSCQYLGQLSKEVVDAIVSNTRNIIAFKVSRQDATLLSSIMEIKVEEYFKKHRATTELEESKKEMFVRLHQRECIVRLFDGVKYLLPMKLRMVDAKKWGMGEYIEPYKGDGAKPPGQDVRKFRESQLLAGPDAETRKGVPLRYAQEQPGEMPQRQTQVRPQTPQTREYGQDNERYGNRKPGDDEDPGDPGGEQDPRLETQDQKAVKPDLPEPISEGAWLRETPDAIYQLEKANIEARADARAEANKIKQEIAAALPVTPTSQPESRGASSRNGQSRNESSKSRKPKKKD